MFLAADADLFIGNTHSSLFVGISMLRARPPGIERDTLIYNAKESQYSFAVNKSSPDEWVGLVCVL